MHPPYHLYEFGLGSFEQHALKNDYEIAHHEYYVASQTYLPQFADSFARRIMEMTKSGMQLEVWLRKKEGTGDAGLGRRRLPAREWSRR